MKLLQSLLTGDEAAFEKLCSVYSEKVRSMARSFVARNSASAHLKDDLISEGVLAVVTTLRAWQAQPATVAENVEGYIATAIRNGFLSAVENEQTIRTPVKRRGGESKFKQANHDLDEVPESEHCDPEELMEGLRACCNDDIEFAVLQMRLEGLNDDAIARCLRVSESTVRRLRLRVHKRYTEGQ